MAKGRKQKASLAARIKDWDNLRGDEYVKKKKMVGRSSFTKPGSNKK